MIHLNFLMEETFRSNASYALIELSNFNRSEQKALAGLSADKDVYGVFKPLASGEQLNYKVAYKDVALLFYFLQQPSQIPAYLKNTFDDDINTTLAKLVLDGILEIRTAKGFVSGAASQEMIYKTRSTQHSTDLSHIAQLSYNAIRYGLELDYLDSKNISTRLYCYNTAPRSFEEDYQLNTVNEVEEYLRVGNKSKFGRLLEKNWHYQPATESYPWLNWTRNSSAKTDSENNSTYKIYISPPIGYLPEVFENSVKILTSTKAFSFKTGSNLKGLLRPDKYVVYFNSYDDLLEAAAKLVSQLKGMRAQGVPFTGQLDDSGLISWGVDPPGNDVLQNLEGASWRATVIAKITAAILQTKSESLAENASVDFIINKISLEGIDPFAWTSR